MPYCRRCGAEVQPLDTFCSACGNVLPRPQSPVQSETSSAPVTNVTVTTAETQVREMNVFISPARIIAVSILSFGYYFFYWFYLTWKHYRDYTRTENYPVWHALTLFVPVYYLFRVHAHIRSFKELMVEAGIPSNLSPGFVVVLVLVSNLLSLISWRLFFIEPSYGIIGLDIVVIGVDIGMLVWVQTNLNRYWGTIKDIHAINARIGVGEVIFILLGVLSWIGTFLP